MNEQPAWKRAELEQLEKAILVEKVLELTTCVQELEAIVLKQAEALQALSGKR